MSWASLANNQTVSFNNLQNAVNNGVFTAKTSIPASNEQITKVDANTYVNINTSYGPYAAKASNQLVVKSDLIPATTDGYSSASAENACTAGIAMTGISFIGGTGLCDSTSMQADQFIFEIAGATIWVSIGGQVRQATINDPNFSGIATFVLPCSGCGISP